MRFAEILQKVKGLESDDIYELLNNRGVVIQHRPDLFIYSDSDARIITNPLGDTWIFLRLRPGESPQYENFILWHELGHLVMEGKSAVSRSFSQNTSHQQGEIEANTFALLALISQRKSTPSNWYELAHKIGMPYLMLSELMNSMRKDSEFINYISRK